MRYRVRAGGLARGRRRSRETGRVWQVAEGRGPEEEMPAAFQGRAVAVQGPRQKNDVEAFARDRVETYTRQDDVLLKRGALEALARLADVPVKRGDTVDDLR